jgi:teichuronic acid biosynthesis glycosyltransferase TuaC
MIGAASADPLARAQRPLHVLVLSRNYPNRVFPHLGLWVQRQTAALARRCRMSVIAPIPYCPPGPWPRGFKQFRDIEALRRDGEVEVHHTRFVTGPGNTSFAFDSLAQHWGAHAVFAAIQRRAPIDVVHAHFAYPDGATALALARPYGIPVVITEHNFWKPAMDDAPRVRRIALHAIAGAAQFAVVSRAVKAVIDDVAGRDVPAQVVPIGVDGDVFTLKSTAQRQMPDRILYVGYMKHVKGVDALLRAMPLVLAHRPQAHLTLIGSTAYRSAQPVERALRDLATALGLAPHVTFVDAQPEQEVARAMRVASLLVLPSRRESCGSVLLEALASGTPVVATRSGGPDDIVGDEQGELVPVDDVPALASAITRVLDGARHRDPQRLRQAALQRYSWDRLADEYLSIYRQALAANTKVGPATA